MKYVIVHVVRNETTRVFPFIFPETLVHSEVAKRFVHAVSWDTGEHATVRSAGFCHIHNNEFQTTRGSESLGIEKGHPAQGHEDYKILNMPNAMQGILL